mgnify:CR=1 FL=1
METAGAQPDLWILFGHGVPCPNEWGMHLP